MPTNNVICSLKPEPAEIAFFQRIYEREDPLISQWAQQYHYFSLHQAPLLAKLIVALNPVDYVSLTTIAKSLYEEFGSGSVNRTHSMLLACFCHAAGIRTVLLPIRKSEVIPQLRKYLDGIDMAYLSGDLSTALGAYCFLERSAVLSYPTMLSELLRIGFSRDELIFFETHVIQEAEHAKGALSIANRMITSQESIRKFTYQFKEMEILWRNVWEAFCEL